eukprot:11308219-Heterocapsa_arctica.AAC.1
MDVQVGGQSGRRARKVAREEKLREDTLSTRHLMTHFPYNPFCLDCAAKMNAQTARRQKRADPVQDTAPAAFGDLVAMDHLILRGPDV